MTIHQPPAALLPTRLGVDEAFAGIAATRRPARDHRRAYGVAATAAVHLAVLLAFLIHPSSVNVKVEDATLDVSILPETDKPKELLVPPKPELKPELKPLILPVIQPLEEPTNAITVPQEKTPPPPPAASKRNDSFYARLFSHLSHYKRPQQKQGIVQLRFTMDRAGHVLAASIAQSSSVPELDAEALALVLRAQPLPAIPSDMPQDRLELIIPIEFTLHR
jgi:protein TonB